MDERKLYAANTIVHGDVILRNGVVNIVRAAVQSYSPLDGEQANTIWLGGEIVLKEHENGELRAFHRISASQLLVFQPYLAFTYTAS